mmetsp:Transcript_8499/g.31653  ORF Transcript_8499/g.31653 Transcript_8499/m.31653 type:complete len:225 (+) Transcript_8499:257-931(+)
MDCSSASSPSGVTVRSESRAFAARLLISGLLPMGNSPVDTIDKNSAATASGSKNASPVNTVAASFPTKPAAKSPSEIANNSSSRLNFGAASSNTCAGDANVGTGVELPETGSNTGPEISCGLGNDDANGSHAGGLGNCAKMRVTPLRMDWRNNKSAAVSASRSSKFRKLAASGCIKYFNDCSKLAASSGSVSRSTNTSSLRATIPMALFNITARRWPCKMLPPP